MENFIGWTLFAVLGIVPVLVVYWMIQRPRRQAEQHRAEYEQAMAKAARDREAYQQRVQQWTASSSTTAVSGTRKSYAGTATAIPTASSTASESDTTLQDLALLYVLNSALEHGSSGAGVTHDDNSTLVESSSRSDHENRRVVQDSFSSSSDSSSSDGPSSDW